MKLKNYLPLLLLAISCTACIEGPETITRTETTLDSASVSPNYSVEQEILKSRIAAIIPADQILFSHGQTQKSGEAKYNTLTVEILPDTLPSNLVSFFRLTDEIQEAVESGIGNMEDYQKLDIVVRRTVKENGVEHTQAYKKEIDL